MSHKELSFTLGRAGLISPELKREGDGATPMGIYPLREVWYRADRLARPETKLPVHEITTDDCWCDDAKHPLYNRHFKYDEGRVLDSENVVPKSFEHLWRQDHAYDLLVVVGYNDAPPIADKGSAIFIHCNHDDGRPTAGCVAFARENLLVLLRTFDANTQIDINAEGVTFYRCCNVPPKL